LGASAGLLTIERTLEAYLSFALKVIYRVDMSNPATLLVAQRFPIKDKDVLYVANAPLTDFAKFVNIVASLTFTAVNLGNTVAR
jgi:polysaccharide export outer membrane protein